MKYPFWKDPNDTIQIIEPTEKSAKKFGLNSGYDLIKLTPEQFEALKNGKMLAWTDGEYTTLVVLDTVDVK